MNKLASLICIVITLVLTANCTHKPYIDKQTGKPTTLRSHIIQLEKDFRGRGHLEALCAVYEISGQDLDYFKNGVLGLLGAKPEKRG